MLWDELNKGMGVECTAAQAELANTVYSNFDRFADKASFYAFIQRKGWQAVEALGKAFEQWAEADKARREAQALADKARERAEELATIYGING